MDILKDTQDFIERYTPDYSRSQSIADEMDLFIALHEPEDMTEDSAAMRVFKSYSQEDLDNNQLKIDWMEARISQLETAIQGYLNYRNSSTTALNNKNMENNLPTGVSDPADGEDIRILHIIIDAGLTIVSETDTLDLTAEVEEVDLDLWDEELFKLLLTLNNNTNQDAIRIILDRYLRETNKQLDYSSEPKEI